MRFLKDKGGTRSKVNFQKRLRTIETGQATFGLAAPDSALHY